MLTGAVEAPRAIVTGAGSAIQNALDSVTGLSDWLEEQISLGRLPIGSSFADEQGHISLPDIRDPGSVTGGIIHSTAKWLTGFAMWSRYFGGAVGLGKVATPIAAGAATDMINFAGDDGRLADLLKETNNPVFNNMVVNYLASDESDSEWEGRFKNMVEGLALGAATDMVFRTLRTIKAARQARKARRALTPAEQGAEAAQTAARSDPTLQPLTQADIDARLGTGDGPVTLSVPAPAVPEAATAVVRADEAAGRADATAEMVERVLAGNASPGDNVMVNLARINEPEDIRTAIKQLADIDAKAINAARGGEKQTFEQWKALAADIGIDDVDILTRQRGQPMDAPTALAYRQLLAGSGKRVTELAQAVRDSGQPADMYAFRRALATHYAIQAEVIDARTATARALASWRIDVAGDLERADAIKMLMDQGHTRGHTGTVQMADAVLALDDPRALNVFTRKAVESTTPKSDAIKEFWINSLLSSPKTHVVNITSNSLTSLWAIPERWMAGHISQAIYSGETSADEALALLYGQTKGMRDGLILAGKALKAGEAQFNAAGKIELPYRAISAERLGLSGPAGTAADVIGSAVRMPSRLLMAEDDFFKSVAYRGEVHAAAYRQAVGEGLTGVDLAKRVADLVENPPESIRMIASEFADVQTFTNPLGPAGQSVMRMANTVPGMRYVLPFIRTPTNILKYAFARTPLAPLVGQTKQIMRAGSRPGATAAERAAAAQAWGRVSVGTMTMLAMADLVREGSVTGAGPADPQLTQALRRQGIPAYGVRIGDRWYTYNRTDPLGLMLGVAADIAEISGQAGQEESEKLVTAGVFALANNLANKTYLRGLSDLMSAIKQPEYYGMSFVSNFAASFVPFSSLVRNTEGAIDTVRSETRTAPGDPAIDDLTA
ncbi:MAG: hypothetical protein KDI56_06270, partial [Xanthomonadales bacterium]|nr:hypothetical protein [Xanthomonadales bacterium]